MAHWGTWRRFTHKADSLGAIVPDFSAPRIEYTKEYQKEYSKGYYWKNKAKLNAPRIKFEANPKWRRCFAGWEEFA